MKKLILSLIVLLSILLTSCGEAITYKIKVVTYYPTITDTIDYQYKSISYPKVYSYHGTAYIDNCISSTAPMKIINCEIIK